MLDSAHLLDHIRKQALVGFVSFPSLAPSLHWCIDGSLNERLVASAGTLRLLLAVGPGPPSLVGFPLGGGAPLAIGPLVYLLGLHGRNLLLEESGGTPLRPHGASGSYSLGSGLLSAPLRWVRLSLRLSSLLPCYLEFFRYLEL